MTIKRLIKKIHIWFLEQPTRNKPTSMIEAPTTAGITADVIIYTVLLGVMFVCIIPLWHVLMASLSDAKSLLAHDGILWRPAGKINFEGFKLIFNDASIGKGYANTLIYVVGATAFGMLINITGGYVLSRKTKAKSILILFIMFTMMFNGGLIPTYMVIKDLGMVGTRWSLLIPGCTNAFFMIMMMNAFTGVPESTVESARIDGAGHLRVIFQIMIPQCKSMMTVVLLNSVIIQWNSWFPASIYVTNKRDLWPLQLWIKQIVADNAEILKSANPDYNRFLIQYAVIIAAIAPVIIAFPFFQKRLEKGVLVGGVKE